MRAQLDKQAAELAEKTKQLSAREQALLLQAQNLGKAQEESKILKEELDQIEQSRDKLAKISGDRFNSIIERNKENKELKTQLEKLRAEMVEKETALRAQLNKSGLTAEEEKKIAAELAIAQAAEKQYKNLLKNTRDDYEVLTQSLNAQLEELRGEIAHNSPILDEKIVAVNALQQEIEQLKAQAKQATDKDKTEIEDLVKAKNEQQKLYENVIANAKQEIKEQNEIIVQLQREKDNIKEQRAQDSKLAQEEIKKLQKQYQEIFDQEKKYETELDKKMVELLAAKGSEKEKLEKEVKLLNERLELQQKEADAIISSLHESSQARSQEVTGYVESLLKEIEELKNKPQTDAVKQEIKRVQEERKETEEELKKEQEEEWAMIKKAMSTFLNSARDDIAKNSFDYATKAIARAQSTLDAMRDKLKAEDVQKLTAEIKQLTEQLQKAEQKAQDSSEQIKKLQQAVLQYEDVIQKDIETITAYSKQIKEILQSLGVNVDSIKGGASTEAIKTRAQIAKELAEKYLLEKSEQKTVSEKTSAKSRWQKAITSVIDKQKERKKQLREAFFGLLSALAKRSKEKKIEAENPSDAVRRAQRDISAIRISAANKTGFEKLNYLDAKALILPSLTLEKQEYLAEYGLELLKLIIDVLEDEKSEVSSKVDKKSVAAYKSQISKLEENLSALKSSQSSSYADQVKETNRIIDALNLIYMDYLPSVPNDVVQ